MKDVWFTSKLPGRRQVSVACSCFLKEWHFFKYGYLNLSYMLDIPSSGSPSICLIMILRFKHFDIIFFWQRPLRGMGSWWQFLKLLKLHHTAPQALLYPTNVYSDSLWLTTILSGNVKTWCLMLVSLLYTMLGLFPGSIFLEMVIARILNHMKINRFLSDVKLSDWVCWCGYTLKERQWTRSRTMASKMNFASHGLIYIYIYIQDIFTQLLLEGFCRSSRTVVEQCPIEYR